MKILVTGAGGFIGSRVAAGLDASGHDVTSHVRSRDGNLNPGDVTGDFQVVVNAAGRLGGANVDYDEMYNANAVLPSMLADLCASRGIHLVHMSTPGVTGLVARADENMEYDPWGDYERTKAEGERAVAEHPGLAGGGATILRPDFVYGPGDLHKLPLFRRAFSGIFPLVGRNGGVIRPTYVDDVCSAVKESLPGGILNGGLYNVGGPETVTVRELVTAAAGTVNRKVLPVPFPGWFFALFLHLGPLCPRALSESRLKLLGNDHYVSIEKARNAGFEPRWSIRNGLKETVAWYMEKGLLR